MIGHVGDPALSVTLTDCSGFTAYVIERVAPQLYDAFCGAVNLGHSEPWPSAADYATAPAERLQNVFDIVGDETTLAGNMGTATPMPGDFLAWSAAPGVHDTGHVMVFAAAPVQVAGSPGAWYVTVYDSSGVHIDDTRSAGHHGVGRGTVIIAYDVDKTSGYSWLVSLGSPLTDDAGSAAPTPASSGPTPVQVSSLPITNQYAFYIAPHIAVLRLRA